MHLQNIMKVPFLPPNDFLSLNFDFIFCIYEIISHNFELTSCIFDFDFISLNSQNFFSLEFRINILQFILFRPMNSEFISVLTVA